MIEILEPGPFATVQDGGRVGYAALGVPRSGAFDVGALALANRLVGNEAGAAAVEITLGGLAFRVQRAVTVALTGAHCPGMSWARASSLPPGTVVRLGTPARGMRSYLAVRGGIAAATELGSRSHDTLSGLGTAPLRAGDRLAVGPQPPGPLTAADAAGAVGALAAPQAGPVRVVPGPRDDWFAPDALALLTGAGWVVRAESDRVGVRLDGPVLRRRVAAELPSEPTRPGAIQVPGDGRPIVLGPDGPVTGGYPVIAVVDAAGLDTIAQVRPGDEVRFTARRLS